MERTEKDLLGLGLVQDSSVEDVIEYFGIETILNSISNIDIVDYLDSFTLGMVDDKELAEAISEPKIALSSFDMDDICDYIEENGYGVIDKEEKEKQDNILTKIKNVCREIKPRGYIDKEEAKKILCDYIDDWYIKAF